MAMAVALVSGNFVVRQPILTSHTPRALQAPAESACALGMQVHSSDVYIKNKSTMLKGEV